MDVIANSMEGADCCSTFDGWVDVVSAAPWFSLEDWRLLQRS